MTGPNRQPVTPALRQFVLKHDMRIAELSRQPFGQDYREGLLRQDGVMFDSEPPITAILAAGPKGMAMLERIRFSARYSFRNKSSWLTEPVT